MLGFAFFLDGFSNFNWDMIFLKFFMQTFKNNLKFMISIDKNIIGLFYPLLKETSNGVLIGMMF